MIKKTIIFALTWFFVITLFHYFLNVYRPDIRTIKMGYMPVITNLSAPLLDFASKGRRDIRLEAIKFSSFADMADAFKNDEVQAAFIIAPLALVMKDQGVDLKIVYIGNRNESTLVARKDLNIDHFSQLAGKKIAIPIRFSGHNLFLHKMADENGINSGQLDIVEMQPPDMATALINGEIDAYCVGEPFAAQTLASGDSRLIMRVEEKWPNFICNLVTVKKNFISNNPELANSFIKGLARAGIWAKNRPDSVIDIASTYWNRTSDIVEYAFNTPPDRIDYLNYQPHRKDIKEIADLMLQFNLIERKIDINSIIDSTYLDVVDTTNLNIQSLFSGFIN
jgi:NitT/TauT family transport system substrate-binding protein